MSKSSLLKHRAVIGKIRVIGGGEYNPISREFALFLEKNEVEKLVDTALNEKLLKKLKIKNLAQIDKVSQLENKIQELSLQLKVAKSEITGLRKKIARAIQVLSDDA